MPHFSINAIPSFSSRKTCDGACSVASNVLGDALVMNPSIKEHRCAGLFTLWIVQLAWYQRRDTSYSTWQPHRTIVIGNCILQAYSRTNKFIAGIANTIPPFKDVYGEVVRSWSSYDPFQATEGKMPIVASTSSIQNRSLRIRTAFHDPMRTAGPMYL